MRIPDASIIIPTYNYGHFILDAIDSVLKQSIPKHKIEIIIIDDGSTDNTRAVLRSYIENNTIQYFYQKNKGKASATRIGIEKSQGRFIFNLDADDVFLPGKISRSIEIFESDPAILHVATPAVHLNENCEEKGIERIPAEILDRPMCGNAILNMFYSNNKIFGGGSTYAVRASAIRAIQIPDEVDMFIDEFLLLAVLPHGKSYFISTPLSGWRVHNCNYSGKNAPEEGQILKGQRILKSSLAVLSYLKKHSDDRIILKIYKLQDANRRIAYKENIGTKNIRDILLYAFNILFVIRPSWKQIKKYQVINRMLPTSWLRLFKGILAFRSYNTAASS